MEINIRTFLISLVVFDIVLFPIWGLWLYSWIENKIGARHELAYAIIGGIVLVWVTVIGIADLIAVILTATIMADGTSQLSVEIPKIASVVGPLVIAISGGLLVGNLIATGLAFNRHDKGQLVNVDYVYQYSFLAPGVAAFVILVCYFLIRFAIALAGSL